MHLIKTSKGMLNADAVAYIVSTGANKRIQVAFSEKSGLDFEGEEAERLFAYFESNAQDLGLLSESPLPKPEPKG